MMIKCPRNENIDCWYVTAEEAQLCLEQRICQAQGDKPKDTLNWSNGRSILAEDRTLYLTLSKV